MTEDECFIIFLHPGYKFSNHGTFLCALMIKGYKVINHTYQNEFQ